MTKNKIQIAWLCNQTIEWFQLSVIHCIINYGNVFFTLFIDFTGKYTYLSFLWFSIMKSPFVFIAQNIKNNTLIEKYY